MPLRLANGCERKDVESQRLWENQTRRLTISTGFIIQRYLLNSHLPTMLEPQLAPCSTIQVRLR